MTPEINLPPSETNLNGICETCHHPSHEGRPCGQLCMWDRPGGAPGNGYCHCGAAAQASTLTTTNQAAAFFVPLDELPELPACAAINANGVIFAGRCHADCLKMAVRMEAGYCTQDMMGFMTTRGRWVSRTEAMKLARLAGMKCARFKGVLSGNELFSEDLY